MRLSWLLGLLVGLRLMWWLLGRRGLSLRRLRSCGRVGRVGSWRLGRFLVRSFEMGPARLRCCGVTGAGVRCRRVVWWRASDPEGAFCHTHRPRPVDFDQSVLDDFASAARALSGAAQAVLAASRAAHPSSLPPRLRLIRGGRYGE